MNSTKISYSLKEVHWNDYPQLINQLSLKLPDSAYAHGTLDIYYRYGPFEYEKMKVYVADQPGLESLVLAVKSIETKQAILLYGFWDTDEVSEIILGELILSLPGIESLALATILTPHKLKKHFDDAITTLGDKYNAELVDIGSSKAIMLNLPSGVWDVPQVPPDYTIENLQPEAAHKILSGWDYNFVETFENMSSRLTILPGFGAFRKSENGDKELVAWIHQYGDGSMGMTQTLPEHRKKGLAGAITLRCAKEIKSEGRQPFLFTVDGEEYNLKFHQKLGFEIVSTSGWSIYIPVGFGISDFF